MKDVLRYKVMEVAKRGFSERLVAGTSGNYSVYDPKTKLIAITGSGIPYDTMELEDIVIISPAGKVVSGRGRPSSEWPMHAGIYQNKEEITAVVHTHSPYATALAVLHQEIPPVLIEMAIFLGGSVPVAEFALPGTKVLGEKVVKALRNNNACLLANHGVVAVGVDLEDAYTRAVYVEDAAKIYGLASSLGKPQEIPRDALAQMMGFSNS